ncbi:MAG: peptide deformylase [Candidatus Magasanikbacteria bacterium]|uniref:Peptide deformylase n=1 Tax=Candidatus Magasanikbacteria bacterium CG10_big_fil_rev_8_21_14_0_10_38_6 TaxID=1974647 RepID=A0A2M6NZZ2_9BACT|nr:peptide deformylase [Candidatus Magasanikbacteria bacterium]NCS72306.1 peptide deformylase [Candidatus Magasanikbacteria bacterium]PIR77045.1 MAG: peptide deformylase [Candidatus Magasanikbacteria bacterium CG10_big_fil_rev_8_21_14_0_10_38_6]
MMLDIITHPNPSILQQECTPVVSDTLKEVKTQEWFQAMIATMHYSNGIGIAGPQVGVLTQACIIGNEAFTKKISVRKGSISLTEDLVLVNPTWHRLNRRTAWDTEGCLSIPKTFGKVKRSTVIRVECLDRFGNELVFDAHQFFARVIQHEIDHLHGVLFIEKAKDIYDID